MDQSPPREVAPLDGYRIWAPDYDRILSGNLEIPILTTCGMQWAGKEIVDIGCGTGRTGAFIRSVARDAILDGIDFCPEMLDQAQAKGIYRHLRIMDILAESYSPASRYDAAVSVLVANHLDDIAPLYALAEQALRPGGEFLLIEYHPFMVLSRREIALRDSQGMPVVIRNRRHPVSRFISAGLACGLRLTGCWESEVTESWAALTPSLAPFVGKPVGLGLAWSKLPSR